VIKPSVNTVRNALCAAVALATASLGAVATARPTNLAQSYPETGSSEASEPAPTAYVAQRGSLSLAQATQMAQSRYRGRVVRAETVQQGGRVIHEIRILGDDGRVRTVRVDAETGAIM